MYKLNTSLDLQIILNSDHVAIVNYDDGISQLTCLKLYKIWSIPVLEPEHYTQYHISRITCCSSSSCPPRPRPESGGSRHCPPPPRPRRPSAASWRWPEMNHNDCCWSYYRCWGGPIPGKCRSRWGRSWRWSPWTRGRSPPRTRWPHRTRLKQGPGQYCSSSPSPTSTSTSPHLSYLLLGQPCSHSEL